jgi:hypothetical protein
VINRCGEVAVNAPFRELPAESALGVANSEPMFWEEIQANKAEYVQTATEKAEPNLFVAAVDGIIRKFLSPREHRGHPVRREGSSLPDRPAIPEDRAHGEAVFRVWIEDTCQCGARPSRKGLDAAQVGGQPRSACEVL